MFAGTRIPVWLVCEYYALGMTCIEICEMHPQLDIRHICAAINYKTLHHNEIEADIRLHVDLG